MAINRAQLAKELEPGLNALFGMEYSRYENEHTEIFDQEASDRAFEEEVMLVGLGGAIPSGLMNVCAFNPEKTRHVLASLMWRTAAV